MKNKLIRKILVGCAAALVCVSLAGCAQGKSGEASSSAVSTESSQATPAEVKQSTEGRVYAKDMDLDKYVTLKDYTNFKVDPDPVTVDEEELEEILDNVYVNSFPAELGIKDRAVALGDTANIDYVGKKDGVAFDGGTATGSNLGIGSHTFIDGFEDGLIGVMPGETVDLNLKFPENYHNEELAGADVVFTVTVNYIIPEEKMDEAIAGIIEEVNTIEELRQYIYDYLEMSAQNDNQDAYEEKIMDTFIEEYCEIKELPEEWISYYGENVRNYFVTAALQMATDPETLVQTYYGQDLETFCKEYAELATRRDLAMQAVAKKENITLDDAKLDEVLQQYATESGASSVAEYLGEASKEDFRQDYIYEEAFSLIIERASN